MGLTVSSFVQLIIVESISISSSARFKKFFGSYKLKFIQIVARDSERG